MFIYSASLLSQAEPSSTQRICHHKSPFSRPTLSCPSWEPTKVTVDGCTSSNLAFASTESTLPYAIVSPIPFRPFQLSSLTSNADVRAGHSENAWVNVTHLITYLRYLRFMPNRVVLSLLANEDHSPKDVVHHLKPGLKMKVRPPSCITVNSSDPPLVGLLNRHLDTRPLDLNGACPLPRRPLKTAPPTLRPPAACPTAPAPAEPPATPPTAAAAGHAALQLRHGAQAPQSARGPVEQARLCAVREC
jgi:hypothetical protein